MATVKLRHTDATWRAFPEGKLKIGWAGAWVSPSTMKICWNGAWINTGYVGSPAEPINLAVNAWATHDAVSFKWGAGSGGAAVSDYQVTINNEANTGGVATKFDTASPSVDFTEVVQNTKYNVYVRARSASGLVSDWVGPLKIKMGKDAVTTYTTETDTRPFSTAVSVNGYKDALVGYAVPTYRAVQTVRYQISANASFTSALSPYNNREIYRLSNSGQNERFSWLVESIDTTVNVADYWGNGGITGMICRGTGWASGPATSIYRAVGTITVAGYETYNYQQAHTVAAVANGYW